MSKLLIAFLALDVGVNLSKVLIFTWKWNFSSKNKKLFSKKKEIDTRYSLFFLKRNN